MASTLLISIWVKFFFLFTPFFALSMFVGLTRRSSRSERRLAALSVCAAVFVICLILFFFGTYLFRVFGITLAAFRVGAGALLFLSAVQVMFPRSSPDCAPTEEFTVVPMAMPVIVGPATVGALMVMGAEITDPVEKATGCLALLLAVGCLGILLSLGALLERVIGPKGLQILSRVTAIVLASLASQMVMAGIRDFASEHEPASRIEIREPSVREAGAPTPSTP